MSSTELARPAPFAALGRVSLGPNWFTVTMGTGVTATTIGQLADFVPALRIVGEALWAFNIVLFAVLLALLIVQFVQTPKACSMICCDPVGSMFVGAIPMGLATIVNGIALFLGPSWPGAYVTAERLWVIDVVLAVASGVIVPYFMSTKQQHSLEKMSALWLLPIVPSEVCAASLGALVPHLAHAEQAAAVVAGLMLWAFSVPAAFAVLTVLMVRLYVHKIPPKELGVSGWLTLGPLGTGALALVLLGNDAVGALQGTAFAAAAPAVHVFAIAGALVLWTYGLWWWILGIAGTLTHAVNELPFNMGWWGFTFPLGVFAAATYALAHTLSSPVFATIWLILAALLIVLDALVSVRTAATLRWSR